MFYIMCETFHSTRMISVRSESMCLATLLRKLTLYFSYFLRELCLCSNPAKRVSRFVLATTMNLLSLFFFYIFYCSNIVFQSDGTVLFVMYGD